MLAEKLLSQPGYLSQILRFFRTILVNFFPYDVPDELLSEIVHSLFNLDAPLYNTALQSNYRKQMNNQLQDPSQAQDDEDLSLEQKRVKSELNWRRDLKVGGRVDCILQKLVQNNRVSHWAPGTIQTELDQEQFYVVFDNESNLENKIISRFSPEIAPPGTFTDDFDWRYELKEGDEIDCMDSLGVWYRSTVLSMRNQTIIDGRDHKEIYVGYRVYEKEGHKTDDDGRKYIGWSNKYDDWISITSPMVQRQRTVVKHYEIAGQQTMSYDIVVDDQIDVMQNTKNRKIWALYRNNFFSNLKCIPDYLNEFGLKGGFNKIIEFLQEAPGQRKINMRQLYHLMDFLSKTMPLWHRQFACSFIPSLKSSFERAILFTDQHMNGPTQQKFSKESLSGIQRSFQNILRRYFTAEFYLSFTAKLSFNIGFSLMESEKLEHRIQGLKEIVEQIKGNKFSARKTLNLKDVMQKLKDENIFEMIFGEKYHIQLIQRSQEIIKFYINEKELTDHEIDYIWQATKKDQQTKMEIYKIISEIALMFRVEDIEKLVAKFAQVEPENFVEKEIECVYELSKYSHKQASYSQIAAQLFWDIAVQERPYKKQIIEMALDKLIELIRNWERELKGEFVYRCIDKISDHISSIQCIKIMQKILDQIPSYRVSNNPTIYETAIQLVKDADLINLIINDLKHYSNVANELWNKQVITPENVEQFEVLNLPFSHRSQIFIRLNFIRNMLQYCQSQIQREQLDRIWDILMVKTKITIDSDIFFNWLKQLLNDQNKLSQELIQDFFQTKVCSKDVSFKTIRKAGFDCICNIFLQINEQDDKIVVLSLPSSQANQNTKLDFRLHVPPNELTGIDLIWKLLQECDKKNMDLTAVVIDLITKLYHNLTSSLDNKVHEVEDQFCLESLSRLKAVVMDPTISDDEKKQFVKILTAMIKSFFEDSEKNGTGWMRTHQALDSGLYVENIVIQNNITSQKNTPRYIVVNVHSNMTIWELKKLVAEKTKQSPLRIQLNRNDQKKKQITDQNNLLSIRDFKFTNYEQLYAQKKPLQYQPRVPLLNKRKELMPEARAIFESWFMKFSTPDGYMTPETCVQFIMSSTSDQTVNTQDNRIVRLFNEYDKDIDGKLTQEEFLEFYKDRAQAKLDLVWQNLNSHGIGNDLKPQSNYYSQEDPNELKEASVLPRYKLSSSDTLNELFTLLKELKGPAQEDLWSFITHLRTNSLVYAKLLALNELEDLTNPNNSGYQILYCLQILEYLITEYSVKKQNEVKLYYTENQDYNSTFPEINVDQNDNNVDRQNIPAAPESGKAIALPPAPPNNFNIPQPPTQVPFIGPAAPTQNSANQQDEQQKLKDTLEQFNGQIITETLNDYIFTDQELQADIGEGLDIQALKQNWIQNFVATGGFKVLLQLLTNLNQRSLSQVDGDVLKAKADKECLNKIIKIMKIILLSTFIANSPTQELKNELVRKMSNKEEASNDNLASINFEKLFDFDISTGTSDNQNNNNSNDLKDKKSDDQNKKEELVNYFEPLTHIFVGEVGSQILSSIDFKIFQEQLLSIIQLVLRKKDKITQDDKSIIDQCLSLWISCIVFDADLLQVIYDDHQKVGDIEKGQHKSIVNLLIEQGLLCAHYGVRKSFKDNFKFICESVKTQTLSEAPYIFFLRVLLSEIQLVEYRSKESKQYFILLKNLLHLYFQAQKANHLSFKRIFEHDKLLNDFIQTLITYDSKEKKGAFLEDCNLVGYIDVIHELIKNCPETLTIPQYQQLVEELIERGLFTFKIEPLETHITKDVDVVQYEKPFINKCQSADSRSAAYQLIQTICSIVPQLTGGIVAKYWHPLLFTVKKPKKSGYAPRSETRSFHGFSGIKNLGCICYMNAMIQQFFHIPTFRYSLLATDDRQQPNWQNFEGEQVDDNMLHQLMKLFGFLEMTERQDYNPREFCFSFKDFAGQPTNVRIQQDSQEFLNLAFDRLENLLANTQQKYLLKNTFGGKTCSMMICKNCGNLRQRNEDFFNLSLEVKNQKSVYDGLKKFTSGEIISDFQCEACNQRVDVERKTVLDKLPNVLIVHLQRIVYDFDTFMNIKLNSRVEFPNVLNLKPYMFSEIMKSEKEMLKKAKREKKKQEKQSSSNTQNVQENIKNEEAKAEDSKVDEGDAKMQQQETPSKNKDKIGSDNLQDEFSSDEENEENEEMLFEEPEENFQYKLVGVVVHMGTADAGHYISYINIGRNSKTEDQPEWLLTEKDKWLEFNDSLVKEYSNLEDDCFGGGQSDNAGATDFKNDYSRNAYMLIYEKRYKNPVKIVVPDGFNNADLQSQSQVQDTLDCDGTAISRVNSQQHQQNHLNYILPQIRQSEVHYDEESKENFVLINFNSIQKFVPNSIYKMVHNDNHTFLCERQVFINGFFEVTKNLISLLTTKVPEVLLPHDSLNQPLFSLTDRLVFDLLPMTQENKQLIELTRLFTNMLDKNYEQTLKTIQDRILVEKAKLDKDQKTFFESLVSHMEKEVREMNAVLLIFIINKLFEHKNYDMIDTLMNQAFALMPDDLTKNWLKIHQFLSFLFQVTRSGLDQISYMLNKNLLSKLIDFFLENDSPLAVGKKRNVMGSNYATPPLDKLILNISFICRQYPYINLSQDYGQEYEQSNFESNNYKSSPYFMDDFKSELPPLSLEDRNMLRFKAFLARGMKAGYEAIEFGRLMAHLSFENYEFSKNVCKKALVGINKSTSDEIEPYLHVLSQIFQVTDSLQRLRLEWLLGIPQYKIEKPAIFQTSQNPAAPDKMGVSAIDAVNDEILEYKSTLFKTSSTVKESYLQILFKYRKQWSKYALQGLYCILEACRNDTTGTLFSYLRNMDPPSYNYARYIDWIQPYLLDQIDTCMRNFSIKSYEQEYLIAIQVNELFNSLIKPYIPDKQGHDKIENQQKPQALISSQMIQGVGPEPYVIWNILEERIYEDLTLFDHQISIQVRELKVKISESKPNGITNDVLPKNLFQKSYNKQNYMQDGATQVGNNTEGWGQKRRYGRGQSTQWIVRQGTGGHVVHSAQKRNQKGSQWKQSRKKKIIVANEGNIASQDEYTADSQDPQQDYESGEVGAGDDQQMWDDKNIIDENKNLENSMEVEYEDDNIDHQEIQMFQQDKNQDILADYQGNQQDAGNFDLASPQDQDIQQDRQGNGSVPIVQPLNQQSQDNPYIQENRVNQYEEHNQYGDEHQESTFDSWEADAWAVLVFQVVNHDITRAQKVVFTFEDRSTENSKVNLRLPLTRIPAQVMGTKDVLVFTKLRPFEDWGPFKFNVEVEVPKMAYIQPNNVAIGSQIVLGNQINPGVSFADKQQDNAGDGMYQDLMEEKACGACTYLNSALLLNCEICGEKLQ